MGAITRRGFIGLTGAAALFAMTGCNQGIDAAHTATSQKDGNPEPLDQNEAEGGMPNDALVVFFSCTGTTEEVAGRIAGMLGAGALSIEPKVPYSDADIAYYTGCRADREQDDPSARPEIATDLSSLNAYDTILLGYPIWHGQAPRIISTLLENCDLSGKTILPFCTSHSSVIGSSADDLHVLQPDAHWLDGRRFGSNASDAEVREWLDQSGLLAATAAISAAFSLESKSVTLNNGMQMPTNGLGTYSLKGQTCVNSVKAALACGVRLIDTAYIYGNEAEVGQAVRESGVPRDEVFVITKLYPSQFGHAAEAIENALDKMDIGYIDMMLLHHPGEGEVEAYRAMEAAHAAGRIRSLGLSCFYEDELEAFLPQVSVPPTLVQNEMHPYYQDSAVVDYIHGRGIALQAWYPLGGRDHNAELMSDPDLAAIASAHGVTIPQVILRWNLQRGVVVIPGSSNPDHIAEDASVYDFELSNTEMTRIAALERAEKHDWY